MFADLLVILTASLVIIALFQRLNMPPLLGYLCVGVLINPAAFNLVQPFGPVGNQLGELGVVFLLFSLGLEFSLPRLLALRRTVFGLGSMQMLACALPLAGLFYWQQLPLGLAVVLGVGLALSSTAIVSKELTSLGELFSPHGQNAIGVLLFQDLAAVLLLTLLPLLAGTGQEAWYLALAKTLGKTLLLFFGLLAISRFVLPRLFHEVAAARSAELFVLLALVLVLLTAWLTHLLGLSMALGAFLAGMMLGESHYRHQIEADIRPFRDVLLGVFFVSVGMLIDLHLFLSDGWVILAWTLFLIASKGLLVVILVRLRGAGWETSLRSGLALAQGGEFFFALLASLQADHLLSDSSAKTLLVATFCSMLIAPILLRSAPYLVARLLPRQLMEPSLDELERSSYALQSHVLICGYGRVGQSIGRFLRSEGVSFRALDDDPVRVQEAQAGEEQVHYGDSRRLDLLKALGLEQASLLVVAVDNAEVALQIVAQVRHLCTQLPILVRTRDDSHLQELLDAGATEVVPEVLESSLMLASQALLMLGTDQARIQQRLKHVRESRYQLLHGFYHGGYGNLLGNQGQARTLLHAVNLSADARACGQYLSVFDLAALGLEVHGLRRAGVDLEWQGTPLQEGDAVLLAGPLEAIEEAEAKLLAH